MTVYWDTSVFLSFVNSSSEPERHQIVRQLLRRAEAGRLTICTSTFTIVEVIRPKHVQFPVPLTPQELHNLESMFKWKWVRKYQVDEAMAFKASKLARETNLRPADAIHAATAIACGADALHKWDRDYSKVAHLIPVEEPAYMDDITLPLDQAVRRRISLDDEI